MQLVTIDKNQAGQRFDKFLHKYLPEAGTSFLYKMMRKKNITLNGKKADATYYAFCVPNNCTSSKPYWNGTQCTSCPSSHPYWINGQCKACSAGTFYNSATKSCEACPRGTYSNKPNHMIRREVITWEL